MKRGNRERGKSKVNETGAKTDKTERDRKR